MTAAVRSSKMVWFTLAGMLAGYLLVHPFAMLAYTLGPQHPHEPWDFSLWGQQVRVSFSTDMLAMGWLSRLWGEWPAFSWGPGICRKNAWHWPAWSRSGAWPRWKPFGN